MELLGLVEDQAGVDKRVPGPARRLSVELPGHLGAGAGLEVGLGISLVGTSFWALTYTRGISESGPPQ